MLGKIGVLVLLLFVNGLFAAAEIALISANQNKIRKKADDGDKKAAMLREMLTNPSGFLATIQIAVSLVALFSGAYAANNFSDGFAAFMLKIGLPFSESTSKSISILLITIALAYFNLVFGELVPKRIAMKKADSIALRLISPLSVLSALAKPFVFVLSASTNLVLRIMGINADGSEEDVTEEEIRMMVDVGGVTGTIDENEMEMINNVFEFDDKTAGDICTHRTDIVALPADADEKAFFDVLEQEMYSRVPVYEDGLDNIIGILHVKDVFKYLANGTFNATGLRAMTRKPYFVPFSKKTDEVFEEMQKKKIHMAVVLDEYGGTLGILTMEDLIEEVMGNILDEYDEEERPDIEPMDDDTFVISGAADLTELEEYFSGAAFPTEEYNTLSGFLVSLLGRIPDDGELPEIVYNGLTFRVLKVEDKVIAEVLVAKADRVEGASHA